MAELPQFTDREVTPIITGAVDANSLPAGRARPVQTRRRSLFALIDLPVLIVVLILLAIGAMMVYSTTFDWSFQDFGSDWYIVGQHLQNMAVGAVVLLAALLIDYRVIKRFAVLLLLGTIAALIAVLLFSDETFGARRALIAGSLQPGELAELTIVVYMAAWLGSKNVKVRSITYGLIPFAVLVGFISALIVLQPDLSTAATILATAGILFFLAGANVTHLSGIIAVIGAGAYIISTRLPYAQERVDSYVNSLVDVTQANYHAQQVMIAFLNGGWFGRGLGLGQQKFGFLPVPHTDSIFAVIGEELGAVGAMFVIALFVLFLIRGLAIARRAPDAFGSLLAAGITLWIIIKAMINIAVMLNLIPSTGVALPFISYGGSSLVTVMAGAGMLLGVARVTALQQMPEGRNSGAAHDRGWGNRWSRLPGAVHRTGAEETAP